MAEDLVQETMCKALGHLHQFEPGTNVQAWTTVILHNLFMSEVKKAKRRRRYDEPLDGHDVAIDVKAQFFKISCTQAFEWFNKLPELQKTALGLVGIYGMSYEEAAEQLQVPIGTVKSRVSRGRSAMRDHAPEKD